MDDAVLDTLEQRDGKGYWLALLDVLALGLCKEEDMVWMGKTEKGKEERVQKGCPVTAEQSFNATKITFFRFFLF